MNRQRLFAPIRQHLERLRNNKVFELLVIAIIVLSALVIGAKTYNLSPQAALLFSIFDTAITLFFLAEILVRLLAEERLLAFFKQAWNVFDFVIVVASLIPVQDSEMVLIARLLRIFRVLRLVSMIPELRLLVNALFKAMPRMGYVVLLMFVIFYIYGAIGSFLFHTINPTLWDNVSISMLTLFRISTFEDWTDIMYETMEVYPMSWVFYLTFIFLTAFVFLNMMIGIILNVLNKEHEDYNRDNNLGEAGEIHWLKEHTQKLEHKLASVEQLLLTLNAKMPDNNADSAETRRPQGNVEVPADTP